MVKTKNPPKAPIKSLRTIVSDSQNKFMIILLNWSNIVGKGNSKIMMPLELKLKTLEIALPNNIVLAAASKFSPLIMKKANLCAGVDSVRKLKFVIDPAYFKKTKEKTKAAPHAPEISEEEIVIKKQELMANFGLAEKIAETAAKIELLNMKRGQND